MKVLFASLNKNKTKELEKILAPYGIELVSMHDFEDKLEIVEDRDSFFGNAEKKAVEAYEHYGIPTIADDTGLTVDQLDGAPGIYSARYFGEDATWEENNVKLLAELSKFSQPHKAAFVCCAVYYDGIEKLHYTGRLEGEIIKELKGDNGFGYDPLFLPKGMDKTLAELDSDTKNRISHRYLAFSNLAEMLKQKI